MISCNHLSLGGDNKAKLARMAEVLLERFSQVGDTEPPSAVEMAELDALTLALFELTQAREARPGRLVHCCPSACLAFSHSSLQCHSPASVT